MSYMPEVSVVIPTRNRWNLLPLALSSAFRQKRVDIEVVVVDDASSEAAPSNLEEITDPRVKLVHHESWRGVAGARNTGIEQAKGEWIAFLDDDDIWSPQKLRSQLDAVAKAGASFAYTAAVGLDEQRRGVMMFEAPDPREIGRQLFESNVMPAGASNVMARTSVVRSLSGFDERLFQLADWDLWIRLAAAEKAAASPRVLVGYLIHSGNMLVRSVSNPNQELEYLITKHRAESERLGLELDRAAFSRWIAWGYRRRGSRLLAARAYLDAGLKASSYIDLGRAVGVLLGERAMRLRSRLNRTSTAVVEPAWVNLYR
jgi:glycosyltransferase involved in cell wall biosynthesis